jgi:hypothetical protein
VLLSICHCRRCIALAICALFLFQAAGWQLAWVAAHTDARKQAFSQIERRKDKLLSLTVHSAELAAMRVGKREIRFQNHLYDIRAEFVCADSTRLEIYPDSLEEALIGTLGALLSPAKNDTNGAPIHTLLAQWIGLVYLMPKEADLCICMVHKQNADAFGFVMPLLADYGSCFSPPPEV